MKKFIAEIIGIIFISILLIIGINYAFVSLDRSDNEINKFKDMPDKIQICNVGSSHGKVSFDYSDYKSQYSCFNFGLTSQRFQYDYRLLLNYEDRIEEGAVVFVPVSYFSLWGEKDEERSDFKSMNNRYYSILPPNLIIEYDFMTDVCQHYLPVLSAYEDVIDVFKDALIGDGDNASFVEKEIDFNVSAEEAYKSQVIEGRDASGNRILNKERLEALYDIIRLCKNKNARVILITTPLTETLTDMIRERNPEYLEEFYRTVKSIADEQGVEYYDYAMDERFCNDYSLFHDAHHLNEDGAKKFTKVVMDEVVGVTE